MTDTNEHYPTNPLPEIRIDVFGHFINTAFLPEGDPRYNAKIEVFREGNGRGQVYQMWAVDRFANNEVAYNAANEFGLAGSSHDKENWTQLMEHMSGVAAIAEHLESMLEEYGAVKVDTAEIDEAALTDSLEKPIAIEAGIQMENEMLQTATLVHDVEKPAELVAARAIAENGESASGLENSRENPVIRRGYLWTYLKEKGVSETVVLAAQNTGRSDRFFSELEDYDEAAVKKAQEDRAKLAQIIGVEIDVVDRMTPTERRRASIETKGRVAALVGISDALAAQFKFQGMTEAGIDAMSAHYLTYKKDPESVSFFGQDWPEYYKEVRRYLIDQVPVENALEFELALDSLTHERIFNETVLPTVLGAHALEQAGVVGVESIYHRLLYPLPSESTQSTES